MKKIILKGRKVVGGYAEGEALVTRETISGWGGIDPETGVIIDLRHELAGECFAGKVLVYQGAKGSSGWSALFHEARINGVTPRAMVFNKMTTKVALGSVLARVPAVTDLNRDPTEIIATGDYVKVDGTNGIVEITKP